MISEVIGEINSVIVSNHMTVYDIAQRTNRQIGKRGDAPGREGTFVVSFSVPGVDVHHFDDTTRKHVKQSVERIYKQLIDKVSFSIIARPMSFRLGEKVRYVVDDRNGSDRYIFSLLLDYTEGHK